MSIPSRLRRIAAVSLGALLVGGLGATSAQATGERPTSKPSTPIAVRVIGFNDLHGNLEPPIGSSGTVFVGPGNSVPAGGVAYLATHVKQLRSQVANSFVVSAGDSIGASPLPSALFHDEPTIDALNVIGVKAMAVGNHEFDEGYKELLRIQLGGCHPVDGCQFDDRFAGAKFPILGANVTFAKNRRPALLPFTVVRSGGVNIGVIGVTLKGVPDVVLPDEK
jgi:5'-nucleotidase